jgi:hypothetical protein
MAAVAVVALVPAASAEAVTAPRSGSVYEGSPGKMAIAVSGKRLSIAAFSFRCSGARGRTSLNDIALAKTSTGYRFAVRVHGNVTFSSSRPDENAAIRFSGRFTTTARSVRGRFRVRSSHCHTGYVRWRARLAE